MRIKAAGIVMAVIVAVAGLGRVVHGAQTAAETSCSDAAKSPGKFAGQSVEFYGSMVGFDLKPFNGKLDELNTWACKNKDGAVTSGTFTFWSAEAKWTDAASKASALKDLFRVSGVVKQDATLALKDVTIRLATETK